MISNSTSRSSRGRALLVDDDATVRLLLADFLADRDFEVKTASSGETALALFHAEHFDVILVDFQMAGMTGLEMAAAVRQKDARIPIALITGLANTLEAQEVTQAGINRIFGKPFDLHEMTTWLESLPF